MNKIFLRYKFHYLIFAIITFSFVSCGIFGSAKKNQSNIKEAHDEFYPNENITDGPYIFKEDSTIVVKWLEQNMLFEVTIFDDNYSLIEMNFGFALDTANLFQKKKGPINSNFNNVKKFVAISDMHGQYLLTVKLLRKYGIIDDDFNWNFGEGHLIIDGDIFDRGDDVTKMIWLIYKLKNQADKSGGKVHYLLGNHELMVLNKDLRYVNDKYVSSGIMMSTNYDQLFSENSIIGEWLINNPIILTINDVLFVHAGISPEFIERQITQQEVNSLFQDKILGKNTAIIKNDTLLDFLKGRNGPVWYRGYFSDSAFTEQKLDRILDYFNMNRIVVGHTSQDSIVSLFGGKVFGIDSSIKNGKSGELLIYEKGKFYRGTLDFGKIKL